MRAGKIGVLVAAIFFAYLISFVSYSNELARIGSGNTMLNDIMKYIKQEHPDAAPFIAENMSWTTTSQDVRPGNTRVVYTCDDWTVTIDHVIVPRSIRDITAKYDNKITWTGVMEDNTITETGYIRK